MKEIKDNTSGVWAVAHAKTHLSEILRRAEEEPQQIGKRRPYIVVPAEQWHALKHERPPIGKWLVDNMPRGVNLDFYLDRK